MWRYIPPPILQVVEYIPTKEYRRFRNFKALAKRIGKELIEQKADGAIAEGSSRDMLSVLGGSAAPLNLNATHLLIDIIVRSNISEDPKRQLDEDEILSQMTCVIFL